MSGILTVLLIILGICLLSVGYIALRNRVIFKMAIRNIPRRPTQSILIMVGLMLATLIIAAALTTGDTLDHTITEISYEQLGEVDQVIAFVGDTNSRASTSVNNEPIRTSLVDELEAQFANDAEIDGFLPILTIDVPAVNVNERLSQPSIMLAGLDVDRLEPFGGIKDPDGNRIENAFANDTVVISESLSDRINGGVGSTITIYYQNEPHELTVGAIGADGVLTGVNFNSDQGGPGNFGIAVPLEWVQELTGMEGQARFIAVTNAGDVRSGMQHSDVVTERIESALEGEPYGIADIKQRAVQDAETIASLFMSLFIVLGLFSVAAGILLIFLIFMMLAAERRSEMGMARAVGMKQRHLVQQFLAEGTAYDLGAALIGALAGVGVAFIMAGLMSNIIGDTLNIVPHFTFRSLAVAYALGVTVTFVTIIFASVRAARLNIVAAIRDTPEEESGVRERPRWRWRNLRPVLFWKWVFGQISYFRLWGPLLTPVGLLMMLQGAQGGRWSGFFFSMGISLLGFGLMLLLQRWLPRRPVFTIIGILALTYWLVPERWIQWLLPDDFQGDFEMFFLSGIMMVTFATLIIMWNADVIVWIVSLFGKAFARWLPAVKTAVAYPLASKTKTGLTLAMFALIMFSLVTMGTISANFTGLFTTEHAVGGWDVSVQTSPTNPIDDMREAAGDQIDQSAILAVGRMQTVSFTNTKVWRSDSSADDSKQTQITAVDQEFAGFNQMPMRNIAEGYNSAEEVWMALATNPDLAVIDAFSSGPGGFGNDPNQFFLNVPEAAEETMQPIDVEISSISNGESRTVTVIGVIDTRVSMSFGLYTSQETLHDVFGAPDTETLMVMLTPEQEDNAEAIAMTIEQSLFDRGVQVDATRAQLEELASLSTGFLQLIQGFMGLGLLVGIAALGVISFRAVVERRQQIGMLRAIGFKRNMVAASFLIESMVVATLGVVTGVLLALALSWSLMTSDAFTDGGGGLEGFIVPWGEISFFIALSLIAAAILTVIPARNASSVPIADALRYE